MVYAGIVSTHSRLKATGYNQFVERLGIYVSTHSRLKATGPFFYRGLARYVVSTHSRLKATGTTMPCEVSPPSGFNTQPPEGDWKTGDLVDCVAAVFQHTAA